MQQQQTSEKEVGSLISVSGNVSLLIFIEQIAMNLKYHISFFADMRFLVNAF